jgi:hypothetical protein
MRLNIELRDAIEEAIHKDLDRQKPRHERNGKKRKKHEEDEDADDEMEKLADLSEETNGSPSDIPMGDEDLSDDAMEGLEDHLEEDEEEEEEKPKKKKKVAKKKASKKKDK